MQDMTLPNYRTGPPSTFVPVIPQSHPCQIGLGAIQYTLVETVGTEPVVLPVRTISPAPRPTGPS